MLVLSLFFLAFLQTCLSQAPGTTLPPLSLPPTQPPTQPSTTTNTTSCTVNSDCAATEFCSTPFATCGVTGQCAPKPDASQCDPTVIATICGCDGKNYTNACVANEVGVPVGPPDLCVSSVPSCTTNADCTGSNQFCYFAAGACNASSTPGQCIERPSSCATEAVAPLCGCDGLAYQNECSVKAALISVGPVGSCFIPDPCSDSVACTGTSFCLFSFGKCGGDGFCLPIPPAGACQQTVKNSICGCDGMTYDNQCLADQNSVSTLHNGTCTGEEIIGDNNNNNNGNNDIPTDTVPPASNSTGGVPVENGPTTTSSAYRPSCEIVYVAVLGLALMFVM